jgi:hypothetical protein
MEKNERKGKPIKEVVFSTRNKPVILYSKIYGVEKTNEILDKCFSNDIIISKLLDAEKHGFKFHDALCLIKEIYEPDLDSTECEKKYWDNVKENLLKIYDEEITNAIIEHYHPLITEDGSELIYNLITDLYSDDRIINPDNDDAEKVAVYIEFHPDSVKEYSNIEKKVGNKIIKYPIEWEMVASVFIDSHFQVFGKY